MLKFFISSLWRTGAWIKSFDYFNLGNSFVLYYLFIFFGLPLVYFLGTGIARLDYAVRTNASIRLEIAAILGVGALAFILGYNILKARKNTSSVLGLETPWKEKNVRWTFVVLLIVALAGKAMMFLNGHYLISTRIFHLEPLFGSINASGFGQFTGYLAIPGFALLAFSFTRYFRLAADRNPSYKLWRNFSWFILILEVGSSFLTGNRWPVIAAIMIYATSRHYGYKKSWKHLLGVVCLSIFVIMPGGALYEKPGKLPERLADSPSPGQAVVDLTIGRFSQNAVVSAIIEKTKEYSYGKNLLNFFVSLGPPRFIWKDKPVISFQGNEFGREYGILRSEDFSTNVGPTMVGDLYMSFGIWGILGGLFFIGIVFRFIYNLLISFPRGAPGGVMIYAVLWPDLIKGLENDVASVLAGAVKLALLMYVIHRCLTADWKHFIGRIGEFWRPLTFGVFIWFFIGDTVRKLVPTQPWKIMLVLDMVVLLTYGCFTMNHIIKKRPLWRPSFLIPVVAFGIIFLASMFGPRSAGLGAGLVGFRSYFWFIPLMFLGYETFSSKEQVLRFCKILLYAAIPLFILAGVQHMFPATDIDLLNPFAESSKIHSGDVNIGLASSMFGSAQRFGTVSMFLFFLDVAVKSPAAFFAFASVILSGSRSAFVLSVFGCIALLFFNRKQLLVKTSYIKIGLGALLVVVALWSIPSFRNTVTFQLKDGIPMIGKSRIGIFAGEMEEVWGNHFSWFGKGAGVFSQGVEYVGERQALSYEESLGETGIRNLLLELGMVGLVVFYVIWASIIFALYKGIKMIKDSALKAIGLAIMVFAVAVLLRFTFMHGQTLNDYAVLVPLWFFVGVFFRMKSYESVAYRSDVPARL